MVNNKLENFRSLRSELLSGGDESVAKELRKKSKLTARERLNILFDEGTFIELDAFMKDRTSGFGTEVNALGEGVITGYGLIDGKLVYAYAQDFTVLGGSVGEVHAKKIVRIQEMALKMGAPIVGLQDSGGARIQEGINALGGYAEILKRNSILSGVIPQITAIMGSSAGVATFTSSLSDFTFMVDGSSQMFVTGPKVIESVTGEKRSLEELGGAMIHNTKTGAAHFISKSDVECLHSIRELINLIPSNNIEGSPVISNQDDVNRTIPDFENITDYYEMKNIITSISDEGYFNEVHKYFATNIITGFIRINGQTLGVIANEPKVLDGSLDIDASDKAARFIRFCDSFNIPLLTLVDVPGFLQTVDQELSGLMRYAGKLIYAYGEATVPKVTLIIRRAYGGGYISMGSKDLGADMVFAWPMAEIAVMNPESAANIIFKQEIADAERPKDERLKKIKDYVSEVANPYRAAEMGYVDDVIEPSLTRPRIVDAFNMLMSKRDSRPAKKHGNIPL